MKKTFWVCSWTRNCKIDSSKSLDNLLISHLTIFVASDERSRVILPESGDDVLSTYINANYIRVSAACRFYWQPVDLLWFVCYMIH